MLGFGRTEDFQRYHLIRAMNMLMNSAEVEPLIGEMGICPVRPVNSTYIKIDSGSGPGGLARAHGSDETVAEINWGAQYQRRHRAPHWRGKFSVNEGTMTESRVLGVDGAMSPMQDDYLVMERMDAANMSLTLLMGMLVVEALKGSIKARYNDANVSTTIKYNHSPQLKMDLSSEANRAEWDTYDSADPVSDIQVAKHRLRQHGAFAPDIFLMGANVPEKIIQCESYLNYVKQTPAGVNLTRAMELPEGRFLGMRPVVAEGTYPLIDQLAADYAATATTLTLDLGQSGPLADLSAGDAIVVGMSTDTGADNVQTEAMGIVASVSSNTVTLSAALGKAFKRGDQVVWNRPFVGFDDAFILPGLPSGEHMCWGVAQTPHADGMSSKYIYAYTDPTPIPMQKAIFFGVDGMPFFKRINQHFYFQT